MANPTTNYGWPMPTATDLVTDLPADFAAFGQPVDTSLKALNPETTLGDISYRSATANTNTRLGIGSTGQVLTVVAGVPAWQTGTTGDIEGVTAGVGISGGGTSGTVTVTNSMATAITTAGDLIKGTGSGTFDRLGIGSTGQVLTVAGGVPSWATASSGAVVQVKSAFYATNVTSTSTTYSDSGLTLNITPTSASNKILIMISASLYSNRSGSETSANSKLLRGATTLYTDNLTPYFVQSNTGTTENNDRVTQVYLDSPATTSATTYKLQIAAASGGNIGINTYSGGSTITLMEVTP
jgi:hypothetical protein